MSKVMKYYVIIAVLMSCFIFSASAQAGKYKVLVVMSYGSQWDWVKEISEGIESVIADKAEIKYVYLDTKKNIKGGPEKAKQAYAVYQEFNPDGVITADDNAQSMFVVKYLKDKVKTPVMFCGVNAEPDKYGFPSKNVSGILERIHVRESIAFAQQIIPSVKSFAYIMKESPSAKAILQQVEKEKETYSAKFVGAKFPKSFKEAVENVKGFKDQADLLFIETMQGTKGDDGTAMDSKDIIPKLVKTFGKPTIGASLPQIKLGALCAVIKTGQEQGSTAAKMLLKAMEGTPVSEIPITQNQHGQRILNVTTLMKDLKIKPNRKMTLGTKLIKTGK
ncbi:MAG: ABC transporter substrate-binding protein [Desulfobacterales bacterium]|nr:ABC transporter substrate-binding protein [Desulfobacterales bacterium]